MLAGSEGAVKEGFRDRGIAVPVSESSPGGGVGCRGAASLAAAHGRCQARTAVQQHQQQQHQQQHQPVPGALLSQGWPPAGWYSPVRQLCLPEGKAISAGKGS